MPQFIGNRTVVPRSVGRYLAQIAIVFAAQFAAGKLGDVLQSVNKGGIGPVWPAAGIAVGALLLCGYSAWPGVAAGAFLLAVFSPLPHWAAAVYGAGTTLAALLAVFLLRSIANFDHSLLRVRDALGLIVLGAFGSSLVSSSIGASTLYAAHIRGWSGFGSAWLIYWLGDSTGVLLVTPLVLTLPTLFRIRDRHRLTEFAVLLLLVIATSVTAFGLLPLIPSRVHHMAFAVLPFVMWAAIRFGMSVTALSIFLVATIATVETALGSGPFTTNTPLMNAVLLDIFFGVISVTGLTLAAAVAEREHAERERERLVRERAEAEARLRFAAIVESCEDAIISGTLDGIIVSWNGGAQRIYGYTEADVIGKSINMLVPPELSDEENKILETLRAGGRIEHLETIRVTKTGKRINVSLTISPIKDSSGKTVGISGIARDVTERKQAEQALSKSEERLRLAQQGARLGTFERDVRTERITWSVGLESLYGLPPCSVDGKAPAFFSDLIHPADRERVAHHIQEALKTGQPTEGEWRAIWPDGSVHWIAGRWQALMDDSGEPSRVVGVNMDITERKLTEQRLREYERAVEGSGEMICVVDRDYRYLIANRRFLKMRNMTREQVVGHFAYDVLNKAFFEAVVKPKLDECFQGEVVTYETKYSYPEVGERDIFISYFPIEGANGIDRAACIIQDITDRKRSEESLRQSEERFRLAAQAGRMYSYEWDVTTDVLVRSAEYVKILGVTEPLRFTRQQFMDKIHPDDRPRFIAAITGLTPENPTRDVTYRILLPGGAFVWLKNSGRAFFDEKGKMLRVIGMVADVTDQKLAEEALSDMTRKLVEAQEQERARIARELHDDVNQRLAMLSVELEQLRDDPSDVHNRVQELLKQTTEISNDVQALSHDLHSSQLEYLGVVAGMKSWCREFGERQGMQIDCRHDVRNTLPPEIGLCLFRVLQEALHNAAKHSGVKRIEVELSEISGEVHLTIRDLGKGFDVEAAKGGKGLGLTSMRERVRLVNGTIDIQSKPIGGTTIHVRVPLEAEHGSQRAAG